MSKFKIGDYITPIEGYSGFRDAIITGMDKEYYYLKIPCGKATMKISSENNYKIKDKNRLLDTL
jgi:uncharacterized protein YvpB